MDLQVAHDRARKGPRYLLLSRVAVLGLTMLSTITVARLVSPGQYGLAVMALVVLAFAQTFRDIGVTQAVLRKGYVSPSEMNLIFWVTVASTSVISVAILAAAPTLASFFDEPSVASLMWVAVAGFFISGATLQHRALLERELRFAVVASSDVAAALASLATAVTLALLWRNAWAIVISSVVQAVTAGIIVVVMSGWRPSRPRKDPNLWDLLKFGANSTVYSTSVLASNQAASVIIGHGMGSAALGQYNRAQMLYAMPASNIVQPFARATMPLLLRLRSTPDQYRLAYAALVRRLCVFLMPMGVTLAFAAVPFAAVLLGPRWHSAGLALTALAPSLAFMGLSFAVNDVLVTQNRAHALRNLGLIEAVVRIGAVYIGAQFGLVQTAIAFTVATFLVTLARIFVAGSIPPVSVGDQFRAALPGVVTGAGAGLACLIAVLANARSLAAWSEFLVLSGLGLAGALLAGLCWSTSRGAMMELADVLGLAGVSRRLRARVPRRKTT
jgi:PST family polysaccharide transporter